jgi:glutaredoxin
MSNKRKAASVVIYTTDNCPHCRHAKHWLKQREIPFLDLNVGKPGKIQKQFYHMGGRSVPLFMIGEKMITGFNPNQLQKILAREGLLSLTSS